MAKIRDTILLTCFFIAVVSGMIAKRKFIMDERYVCAVKRSCAPCLKLSHCSWCSTENKCYSKKLNAYKEFCPNSTIDHKDYGLSLEENAKCSCNGDEVEQRCYPPGVTTGPECSDRGTCVCGRCVCNPAPDPAEPTKMVMGEYCEFDNFSCEGPRCNEGPYSINKNHNTPASVDEGLPKPAEVDIPAM